MERDFLVTRVLLVVTGLLLVAWVVFWFLDERSLTSPQQNHVQGLMSPAEAAGDSLDDGFPEWKQE